MIDTNLEARKKFFAKRFTVALEEWKRKNKEKGGKSDLQKSFALMIGVTDNMIPQYKSGKSYPRRGTIENIIKVLGVPDDYFTPTTHDELYEGSSEFITELGRRHVEFSEEIGLDLNMVKALHSLLDWDTLFPQYSPIIEYRTDLLPEYKRQSDFAESAPIDPSLDFLQIERDGQTLTLHRCDLAYLKEVQDKVVELVEFLFYKRHGEMEKEVEEVNRRTHLKTTDGGEAFRPIHKDEMFEIDRFAKYAYKDEPEEGGQDNGEH